jgi:hypothetical protein
MHKRLRDPSAIRAIESVFRASHGRDMSDDERRYFKLPDGGSGQHAGKVPQEEHQTQKPERSACRAIIAWLISRSDQLVQRRIEAAGFRVLTAYTTDKLVADCVNQAVDIVILDANFFVETAGWSVARSVKHIKPDAYVILIARQSWPHDRLPKGVDAILPAGEVEQLFALLEQLYP